MKTRSAAQEIEKLHTLTHYRDVAGQAQAERRLALPDRRAFGDRRLAALEAFAAKGCLQRLARPGGQDAPTCRDTLADTYWCSPCIATAALFDS